MANEIKGPGNDPWDINYSDLEGMRDLSSGNFGVVYKASYFGTDVAVKKLLDVDDTFMHKYIEREMAMLKSLRHPHIVQFMGLCKHQNQLYIVTEFVAGGDLRQLLKKREVEIPWKNRVKMAMDIAHALTYLHSRKIVHRDIKSNNALLEPESNKIKLCDFGFARESGQDETMTLCGTDEWMAPEVGLGQKYDTMADVFSFGMVLVEFMTRRKPAKRQPGRKFAVDVEQLRRDAPPETPPEFLELAIRCTVWDPERRPAMKDCLDFLKALYEKVKAADKAAKAAPPANLTYMSGIVESDDDDEPVPAAATATSPAAAASATPAAADPSKASQPAAGAAAGKQSTPSPTPARQPSTSAPQPPQPTPVPKTTSPRPPTPADSAGLSSSAPAKKKNPITSLFSRKK